jgi:hypothetical protein
MRMSYPSMNALNRVSFGAAATGMLIIITLATVPIKDLDFYLKLGVQQAAWVSADS